MLDVAGSGYPGDVGRREAVRVAGRFCGGVLYVAGPEKPVLALRAGGKKLWGPFPYFDAAFLGGSETFRDGREAAVGGRRSVYGTAELRVPIAKFPFILPLDVGALGFMDMGRVYVNGHSPGGWQKAAGGGFWVGFLDPGKSVNVLFTNRGVTSSLRVSASRCKALALILAIAGCSREEKTDAGEAQFPRSGRIGPAGCPGDARGRRHCGVRQRAETREPPRSSRENLADDSARNVQRW